MIADENNAGGTEQSSEAMTPTPGTTPETQNAQTAADLYSKAMATVSAGSAIRRARVASGPSVASAQATMVLTLRGNMRAMPRTGPS